MSITAVGAYRFGRRYTKAEARKLLALVLAFVNDDKMPTRTRQAILKRLARARLGLPIHQNRYFEKAILDPQTAQSLRENCRSLLAWFAGGSEPSGSFDVVEMYPVIEGREIFFIITGDPLQLLTCQFINLVHSAEASQRLRVCAACKTIFIRRRGTDYCSETCYRRIYMREWRKK